MIKKKSVIIIGAGGHAKVIIEILKSCNIKIAYCIGKENDSETCLGIPVLKEDHNLEKLFNTGLKKIFVAIGSNNLRAKITKEIKEIGFEIINAISPYSIISKSATLGTGIAIMPGAIINASCNISDNSIINTGATIDHDCSVGIGCHIGPQCALAGNVTIGEGTFLGIGTKVIPGILIGTNSILGAGSVVINNINSNCTAVGVPAKPIKQTRIEKNKDRH